MTPHAQLIQSARHTRKTLYLVAGFYVVVGFVVAVAAAIQGDRLGTFLGFLIVSGALAMGLFFRAALHLGVRISDMGEGLDELRRRLERIERLMREIDAGGRKSTDPQASKTLDLSEIGRGDPAVLAAATLDRDVYPRLVATMDEEPPAQMDGARPRQANEPRREAVGSGEVASAADMFGPNVGLTTKNLLRQWKVALREGDLAGCRGVLSALIDTAGPEAVEPLRVQIADLTERVERTLRDGFAAHVRDRDYASAIAIGERMCSLLPDRPVVEEFARLRPMLERCAARRHDQPVATPAQAR
jgi:hypothetical protein